LHRHSGGSSLRRAAVRLLSAVTLVSLVQVAIAGRIVDFPLALQVAVYYSLLGTSVFVGGLRPREIGRYWGTMDQRFALEAQRQRDVVARLREGKAIEADDRRVVEHFAPALLREARLQVRLSRVTSVAAALALVGFCVVLAISPEDVVRLAALAVLTAALLAVSRWRRPRAISYQEHLLSQLRPAGAGG